MSFKRNLKILLYLVLVLLIFTIGLNFYWKWNRQKHNQKITAEQMLLELTDSRRFLSSDQVSEIIINGDPSYQLIDVREKKAFDLFALPKAINIPVVDMYTKENNRIECEKYKHIFYSNGDLLADRAWFLHRQNGCQGAYVMKGGLNTWTETILQAQVPLETDSDEVLELYSFRKAAGMYFTGNSIPLEPEKYILPLAKKSIVLKPKKIEKKIEIEEEEEEEEGC